MFAPFFARLYAIVELEVEKHQLEHTRLVDVAVGSLQPDAGSRWLAIAQEARDAELEQRLQARLDEQRRQLNDRQRWNNPLFRRALRQQTEIHQMQADKTVLAQPRRYQPSIRRQVEEDLNSNTSHLELGVFLFTLVSLVAIAAVWVAWAFVFRGGLSLRFTGLELVRSDGRTAAHWQCLVRALLFWLPLVILVTAACWLDAMYWSQWPEDSPRSHPWMPISAWGLSWLAGGLLVAYFARALWDPERSWHDRLAGTWLVPR